MSKGKKEATTGNDIFGIDFHNTITPPAQDLGNRFISGRINTRTFAFMLFTNPTNANWMNARMLQRNGYALATISFPANRDIFRLQVGDLFKLNYSPYNIFNMVVRVIHIEESNLESEEITITVLEDIDYLSNSVVLTTAESKAKITSDIPIDLTHVKVINAPYISAGDYVAIIPLAARELQIELGYALYMSVDDGVSYNHLSNITTYNVFGTLVNEYPEKTYQIDDGPGILIEFTNSDVNRISSISRARLCGFDNMALLGDELISFQTITPVSGFIYRLTGVYRGRFDTEIQNHEIGTEFYFLGGNILSYVENSEIISGSTRKFKLVPFTASKTASVADATAIPLLITGRAKIPYRPSNLDANGDYPDESPTYETDIVLTWDPRLRGDGAGFGSEVFDINEAPIAGVSGYEGYFRVKVYVNDILVRTTSSIADFTWTYTSAMNIIDNGALASSVTLRVTNYRVESGYEYESTYTEIDVTLI